MSLKVCLHTWSLYRAEKNWSIFSIMNKVTKKHTACMSHNKMFNLCEHL